jgi:soluble lytic murein transglycosylase
MYLSKILTPLVACALLATPTAPVLAQPKGDQVLLDMQQAFRKGDRKRLEQLLPQAKGHALEPWAAYWELKARLNDASAQEVQGFLQRWAGTYHEDRLRNDWLQLLGQRRDWAQFAEHHAQYRMQDDKEVRCYALLIEDIKGTASPNVGDEVRRLWHSQRDADDGCAHAAAELLAARKLSALDVWRKARLAVEANRPGVARKAVEIVAPDALPTLREALDAPSKFLRAHSTARGRMRQELVLLALIKLAGSDIESAASQLDAKWGVHLSPEERNWAWGVMGKVAAQKLSPSAMGYYANVTRDTDLNDDQLAWKVRAALRAGQWREVRHAIDAMGEEQRQDATWVYWKARALLAGRPNDHERAQAQRLLEGIAGTRGFYEQLALEELGQRVTLPPAPALLTEEEKAAARANPGLNRALYAILIGLRGEGVREWNYSTNLHRKGGMNDRELLAAADLACQREVWDRCINTSERTAFIDLVQRFPMPFRDAVVERAKSIGPRPGLRLWPDPPGKPLHHGCPLARGCLGPDAGDAGHRTLDGQEDRPDGTSRPTRSPTATPTSPSARPTSSWLDDFGGSMPWPPPPTTPGPDARAAGATARAGSRNLGREHPVQRNPRLRQEGALQHHQLCCHHERQPQSLKARLGTVGPRGGNGVVENADLP